MMNNSRKIIVLLMIIIVILIIALSGAIIYIVVNQNKESNKTIVVNSTNRIENILNNEEDINNELINNKEEIIENMATDTFNSQFTTYEGEENTGSQVKTLISHIETNNSTRTDGHIVALSERGITNRDDVSSDKKYTIKLAYDDEGYVNEITITENEEDEEVTPGSIEALIFNSKLTPYVGEVTGDKISELITAAQENVQENPEHEISVSSNNIENINDIAATEIYIVTTSYDSSGYINKINIDKKN